MNDKENDLITSNENNEQQDNQHTSSTSTPKNILKKVGQSVANTYSVVKDKLVTIKEESALQNKIEKLFEKECETFTISELLNEKSFTSMFSDWKIKGIRNSKPNTILIKENENLLKKINAGMNLIAESDKAVFEVLEKDIFNHIDYPINTDNSQYTIKCFCVKVALVQKQQIPSPMQNITNITQSVVVHGSNEAPINQIADINNQLSKIEGAIKNLKGGILNTKKKEAEKMFSSFKNCILSKEKNDTLFDKFLRILKSLSLNTAVAIATELITQTFGF